MDITLGAERERFIVDKRGKIIPAIGVLLPLVRKIARKKNINPEQFGHELFAGQIEDRTPPCRSLEGLSLALKTNDQILNEAIQFLDLEFDYSEFVEENQIIELAVNPFDERHKNIWESITFERRLAASRVAAVHVHISTSINQAVRLLNICCDGVITRLAKLGDHSDGKRLAAYRVMTGCDSNPPQFKNANELLEYINKRGGERNVWDFVRYKPSTGTTEFRMFGCTNNVDEILEYAKACLGLLKSID